MDDIVTNRIDANFDNILIDKLLTRNKLKLIKLLTRVIISDKLKTSIKDW